MSTFSDYHNRYSKNFILKHYKGTFYLDFVHLDQIHHSVQLKHLDHILAMFHHHLLIVHLVLCMQH